MNLDYPLSEITRITFAASILQGRQISCDIHLNQFNGNEMIHRIVIDDADEFRATEALGAIGLMPKSRAER